MNFVSLIVHRIMRNSTQVEIISECAKILICEKTAVLTILTNTADGNDNVHKETEKKIRFLYGALVKSEKEISGKNCLLRTVIPRYKPQVRLYAQALIDKIKNSAAIRLENYFAESAHHRRDRENICHQIDPY